MSRLEVFNAFLTERLTAVAQETSDMFERAIGEYQDEISRSTEENKRLKRLLDLVFNPDIKLPRTDSGQFSLPVFRDQGSSESSPNLEQESAATHRLESRRSSRPVKRLIPKHTLQLTSACVNKSDQERFQPPHPDQCRNRENDSLPPNIKPIKTNMIKKTPAYQNQPFTTRPSLGSTRTVPQFPVITEHVLMGQWRFSFSFHFPQTASNSLELPLRRRSPLSCLYTVSGTVARQEGYPTLGHEGSPTLGQEGRHTLGHEDNPTLGHESNPTLGHEVNPTLGHEVNPTLGHEVNPTLGHEVNPTLGHEGKPTLGQEDPENTHIKEELRLCLQVKQQQDLEGEIDSIRVSEPTSLCTVSEPTSLCTVPEPTSLCTVPEPTSLCTVPEPTSLCTVPEPTSLCTVPEPTSLCTVPEPNLYCSAAQSKNITDIVDDVETSSPDCQKPFFLVSEKQRLKSPSLCLKEPKPTKQEEHSSYQGEGQLVSDGRAIEPTLRRDICLEHSYFSLVRVFKEEVPSEQQNHVQDRTLHLRLDPETTAMVQILESDTRGSEPAGSSQLLSAEHAEFSEARRKTREHLDVEECGHLFGNVHRRLASYSEDLRDMESDESSDFSNWSDGDLSDSDSSYSDECSCDNDKNTQTDSVTHHHLAKRKSPGSDGFEEPSAFSNQSGTELSPSGGSKDMNTQTDPVAGRPAKTCKREESPERGDTTTPAAQRDTYVMPPIDCGRSKKHYCLYCGEPCCQISKHLRREHGQDVDVATAFSFRRNSAERKAMLRLLSKRGDFVHGVVVAREGTAETVARVRPKVPLKLGQDYTHCTHCDGLYIQKSLWLHIKRCPRRPKVESPKPGKRNQILSNIEFMLCPKPDHVSTGLWKLVCDMAIGEVSLVVKNDQYILLLGEEMFDRLQTQEKSVIPLRGILRDLARLLIAAKKCTPLRSFEDFVLPANLHHIITAVKAVAGYNEENKLYDRPSLAGTLERSLVNIARTVKRCALMSGQQMIAESADKFQTFKWHEVVMAGALSTLSEPTTKSNKLSIPPRTKCKPKSKPKRTKPTTGRTCVRVLWTDEEVSAVEKHMMPFLKSKKTPGKKDCLKCLLSEPEALKGRNWSGIKCYVHNRIRTRQKMVANCVGSRTDLKSNPGPQIVNV